MSQLPEALIVKSPSISIELVDCIAESPASVTLWKSFESVIPPVVTVDSLNMDNIIGTVFFNHKNTIIDNIFFYCHSTIYNH